MKEFTQFENLKGYKYIFTDNVDHTSYILTMVSRPETRDETRSFPALAQTMVL